MILKKKRFSHKKQQKITDFLKKWLNKFVASPRNTLLNYTT
jgi:hypothetical protein